MARMFDCPHCGVTTALPDGMYLDSDDCDSCGRNYWETPLIEEEEGPGAENGAPGEGEEVMVYTPEQLEQGRNAWIGITTYIAENRHLPGSAEEIFQLPLLVRNFATGEARVIPIGALSPEDIRTWADSEAFALINHEGNL
ncbi:MAG: hypothetical protein Q4F10_04730 [Corynebacterium glutamicum]|nr:hypothetical protein [Corynebacterium glutamicum]